MPKYSEQDLKYAAELREEIHREALAIVRKTRPRVTEVVDRFRADDYYQEHWDYPGQWYTVVATPYGFSRKTLVDQIVRDTLSEDERTHTRESPDEDGRKKLSDQLASKPDGYEELFPVEQENGRFRAVGTDAGGRYILEQYEEYDHGGDIGSAGVYYVLTDPEYRRFARLAFLNGQIKEEEYERLTAKPEKARCQDDDPFYRFIAGHPELAVDFVIVKDARYCGYESHRTALKTAFAGLNGEWDGDPDKASGERITVGEMFSPECKRGKLNYRKAFLHPPHGTGCTGKDFERVNETLFPNGTDVLEIYEWTTDWSDYFDDGHEWWGTLCCTVYDKSLDRFVVIMASATD